jgi:hypothetical protein
MLELFVRNGGAMLSQTFVLRKGDPGKDGTEAKQTGNDGERTDQD